MYTYVYIFTYKWLYLFIHAFVYKLSLYFSVTPGGIRFKDKSHCTSHLRLLKCEACSGFRHTSLGCFIFFLYSILQKTNKVLDNPLRVFLRHLQSNEFVGNWKSEYTHIHILKFSIEYWV